MILEIETRKFIDTYNRNRKKQFIIFKCDQCGIKFSRRLHAKEFKRYFNFCSKSCKAYSCRNGEKLRNKIEEITYQKYGVRVSSQAEETKKKARETCLERYGAVSSANNPAIKEKQINTLIKNYGVDNIFKRVDLREQWMKEKYGVPYAMQSEELSKKCIETFKRNHDTPESFKILSDKRRETWIKKFGIDSPFKMKKCKLAAHSEKANLKRHNTMKERGLYKKSHVEDRLYYFLCNRYENVERNARVQNWPIDFYVKELNTYIQLDGVYWHGLDRPLEIIKNSNGYRDNVIYKKYCTDQKQNEWFTKNNMKLVRITDIEFEKAKKADNYSEIVNKIDSNHYLIEN